MKPHRLQIEAFGPYADPVDIGFDALSQEGLFLIHGPTGAGKTFLLDALCFALYGEVSGDRSIKTLRSDHADPAAVPRVCLEFSAGEARYRVERSPAYTALKSRGAGTTEKAAQGVLFRLAGSEWEPIASRSTEVSREVEGLVGLNVGQFRQVILLPQGKFAEVLRARAEEREALLKTLFDTVIYEQAAGWLDDRAKAGRIAVAEQTRAQEVLRRQAAHTWSPYAPESEAEAEPATQADLERLVERIGAVVASTEAGLKQASAHLDGAQTAQAAMDKLADRWDRRAVARTRLTDLEAKQPAVQDYRQRLGRAERAEQLRPSVEAERQAREALATLQSGLQSQRLETIRARDGARALPLSVEALDLMALPSLDALAAARSDLAVRRTEVAALVSQAQEAEQARAKAAAARSAAGQAEERLNRSVADRERRQQSRQVAAEGLAQARSAGDQLNGLERAAQECLERARAAEALAGAQQRERDSLAAKGRADRQLAEAQAALEACRRRQIAGMAAQLAGGLEPGAPCPVCGALDHPAPAQATDPASTDAALAAAEQAVQAASRAAEAAAVAVAQAQGDCKAVLEKAGVAATDPEAAAEAARAAAAALAAAQGLAAQASSLELAIQADDQALQTLQDTIQSAGTELALQTRSAVEASERATNLGAAISRDLGEGVDPLQVLQGFGPLETALKHLATSTAASTAAASRLEQASGRLTQDLAASEFADGQAVQEALKDDSVRQHWAQRIQAYETEVIELKGLLASADLADLPEQRPDTAAAQAATAAADRARMEATRRDTQARGAQAEIQRLAGEHRLGAEALAGVQERAQLLSGVADRCQGRATPYISLQRWVLSAYLGDICSYANQRLELMTSGRYQLRLTDGGSRGGRQAGLGLRVLDAYTGEEREVSSLSGGETFQASLALALGVADTVQAHAGGVRLEALFIDEGFGTLDPDNLQLAMDELDRLREGGRMIGIISHVGGLRERIRCGIEVLASDRGSTVRVGSMGEPR
ncbi:AAA family ATPase [Cyanobium sp. FACHB-13342]|uniref:AAA family ATPase n=1 Tax=Cyanobium sp. FACHB-13342 TaxID=2692793 RepID=UPI001681A5B5|nr:SMC family ATPase [Cyanobium sp. FACHB-13342]